jgi:hypothetical protein
VAYTTYRDMNAALAKGREYRCKGCVAKNSRGPDAAHQKKIMDLRRLSLDPPEAPTDANPGTEDKIVVMIRRFEDNKHIHHPGDPTAGRDGSYLEWLKAIVMVNKEVAERRALLGAGVDPHGKKEKSCRTTSV